MASASRIVDGAAFTDAASASSDSVPGQFGGPQLVPKHAVTLGEGEVERDDLGGGAIQEIDDERHGRARPRPASERRIQITNCRVVQFDNDDVAVDVGRIGGGATHAPVIEIELERIEGSNRAQREDESGRTESQEHADGCLTHLQQIIGQRASRTCFVIRSALVGTSLHFASHPAAQHRPTQATETIGATAIDGHEPEPGPARLVRHEHPEFEAGPEIV